MALRKKTDPGQRRRSLVASAARYTLGGAQGWSPLPVGDRRWQMEAWRHYDICGELHYAMTWKGDACAQATMYAAEVDPATGQPAGPTDNQVALDIAAGVLGGPAKRPRNIRTMIINLGVAGEVYVVVRQRTTEELKAARDLGDDSADEWVVVSGTQLNQQGKGMEFVHPDTGQAVPLKEKDLLIRLWTKHPQIQYAADSSVRSALPILSEIEKASQNIAARLDSRLVGAGVWLIPQEADLPLNDDSTPADPSAPKDLMGRFVDTATRSLRDPGQASAQVPIMLDVPMDTIESFRKVDFETPLSKEVPALRAENFGRLAATVNLPREVMEGMGESNHWSAEQVAEETYRTHLLPDLDVISDGLTTAYYLPMLVLKNVPDPTRHMLAFDGSSLIIEPDPLERVMELLDRGLITEEAALKLLSVPEGFAPDDSQKRLALARALVTGAPALFSDPALRAALGFSTAPEPAAVEPVIASGDLAAASLLVTYALERAGNRLLSTQRLKDEFAGRPRHELHVQLRPDARHGDLLEGAWRHQPVLAERFGLDTYTRRLLAAGLPHDDEMLAGWVRNRDSRR